MCFFRVNEKLRVKIWILRFFFGFSGFEINLKFFYEYFINFIVRNSEMKNLFIFEMKKVYFL